MNRYDYANLVGDLIWLAEKGLITDLTTHPYDSEKPDRTYITSFKPTPISLAMNFTAREAQAFVYGVNAARFKSGVRD